MHLWLTALVCLASPSLALASAALESPDARLTVTNHDTGLGGTMPDLINIATWVDPDGALRQQRFDNERGRLGWVEAIAQLATRRGTVYVLIAEDKHATTERATRLLAVRIARGRSTLEPVPGFFPAIPGASRDRSKLVWEYRRLRGPGQPRPIAVRVAPSGDLVIDVDPSASLRGRPGPQRRFRLTRRGDRLEARGLDRTALAGVLAYE